MKKNLYAEIQQDPEEDWVRIKISQGEKWVIAGTEKKDSDFLAEIAFKINMPSIEQSINEIIEKTEKIRENCFTGLSIMEQGAKIEKMLKDIKKTIKE